MTTSAEGPVAPLQQRMRDDLSRALKARDRSTAAVLRTALSALANAEAPPVPDAPAVPVDPVVGQLVEHARLQLSEADLAEVLRREVDEREEAAAVYVASGRPDVAEALRSEASVLRAYLGRVL